MADETKVVILDIELDISQLHEAAAQASKDIDDLKAKQKELADNGEKNSVAFQANAAKLRELNGTYKDTTKVIDQANKARVAEKGSLEQMRAQLSISSKEYSLLSKAQRENSQEGVKLKEKIAGLTNELKGQESAIGDNRRNVGNYSDAMTSLPGPLGEASKGVSGLKTQFLQLLANPIVLIIALIVGAIVALKKAFTSTDEGANAFNAKLEQISAIFDVVRQKVASLASGLVALFSGDFEEAASKFGDALDLNTQQFKDAADAAYKYTYAIDSLEDSENNYVSNRAENENKIAKLEFDAADRNKTIDQRKSALLEAIAISKEESDKAKEFAKRRLDAEVEYLAGKNQVTKEEILGFIKLSDAEQANAKKSLLNARNNNEEKFNEIEKLYAKFVEADTAFFENNKKNNSKVTAFQDQLDQEALKKHDEYLKKKKEQEDKAFERVQTRLREAKAFAQIELNDSIKGTQEELNAKIQLAESERNILLSNQKLTNAEKFVIEQQYQQKVTDLGKEFLRQQEVDAKQSLEKRLASMQDASARQQAQAAINFLSQKAQLDQQLQDNLISQSTYNSKLLQLQFEAQQAQRQQKIADIDAQIALEADGSTRSIQLEAEKAKTISDIKDAARANEMQADQKALNAKLAGFSAQASVAANVFGNLSSLFEQGSEEYKAFASLQATASTIFGAIGAFTQASAAFPPPYGQIAGAIAAGVVTATGVAQIAKINALEDGGLIYPKAERGMIIGGEPHSRGGTKFRGSDGSFFEAEKGELLAIVNKRSIGMLGRLNALNMIGGGNNFFGNGGLHYLQDGGFAARNVSSQVMNDVNNQNRLQEVLLNLPNPVVAVQDIVQVNNQVNKVQARAIV